MKRWLSIAAVMVFCLSLVIGIACGGGGEEEEGVKKLKFGIGIPLSGAAGAVAGWPFKWSAEIAEEWYPEFTVAGQRYKWDFVYEDTMPGSVISPAGGHAAATKFIYDQHVDFMFLTPIDAAIAGMMITEELDPPMILFIGYGGMFDIGPDYPHTFVNMQIGDLEYLPLFDYIAKEHPEVKRTIAGKGGSQTTDTAYTGIKAACDYYGIDLTTTESSGEMVVEYYPQATSYMTHDPDMIFGNAGLLKAMWDLGYEGLCASNFWAEAGWGEVPWDKAAGNVYVFMPHPMQEPWPEVAAFATEFEHRFGVEVTPAILLTPLMVQVMSQALEQAGTVDDVEKIVEALETGTFDTMVGPVYFGGEEFNGIGHTLMLPQPIWRVTGPGEYEVVAYYTAEELEALAIEIYGVR